MSAGGEVPATEELLFNSIENDAEEAGLAERVVPPLQLPGSIDAAPPGYPAASPARQRPMVAVGISPNTPDTPTLSPGGTLLTPSQRRHAKPRSGTMIAREAKQQADYVKSYTGKVINISTNNDAVIAAAIAPPTQSDVTEKRLRTCWVGGIPYRLATEMQLRMVFTRFGLATSNITVRVKAEDVAKTADADASPKASSNQVEFKTSRVPAHPACQSWALVQFVDKETYRRALATEIKLQIYSQDNGGVNDKRVSIAPGMLDTIPMPQAAPDSADSAPGSMQPHIHAMNKNKRHAKQNRRKDANDLMEVINGREMVTLVMEKLKAKQINAKWRKGQVGSMSTMLMASGMGSMQKYNQTAWWYIGPDSRLRMTWNVALAFLCFYVALVVPYRVGFQVDTCPGSISWIVELLVDIFFLLDIGLNFVTGIDNGNGEHLTDFHSISSAYVRGWFSIDLLAVLPISYVQTAVAGSCPVPEDLNSEALSAFKTLRLLRLSNLLRVVHLRELARHFAHDLDMVESSWRRVKIFLEMLFIFYIAHLFACMWFYVGTLSSEHMDDTVTAIPSGTAAKGGWIVRAGLCGCPPASSNCTFHPDPLMYAEYAPTDCKGSSCHCQDSATVKYITSLYWSITVLSTVGYGDVTAHTKPEMMFSIAAELCGCMVFASIIGTLSTQMMSKGIIETKVQGQLAELREYCNQHNFSPSLKKRIRMIMESGYREHAFNEKDMFSKLPKVVYHEVKDILFNSLLSEMPLFKNIPGANIPQLEELLMESFVTHMVQPGEVVFEEGDLAFEFYVIIEGEITLSKGGMKRVLRKGSFFGERELFFSLRYANDKNPDGHLPIHGRLRHQTASVTSKNVAQLRFVRWPTILELKRHGGQIYDRIRQAAEARVAEDGDAQDKLKAQGLLTALFDHISDVDLEHRSAMRIQRTWRRNKRLRHARLFQMQNEMLRQLRILNERAVFSPIPLEGGGGAQRISHQNFGQHSNSDHGGGDSEGAAKSLRKEMQELRGRVDSLSDDFNRNNKLLMQQQSEILVLLKKEG